MPKKYPAAEFHYYLATDPGELQKYWRYFKSTDVLISLAFLPPVVKKGIDIDKLKKHANRIILDSGAFTNFNKPGHIKFETWLEYVKEAKSWVTEYVQFDDLKSRANTITRYHEAVKKGLDPLFVDQLNFRHEKKIEPIWKDRDKLCLAGFGRTRTGQNQVRHTPKERFEAAMKRAADYDTVVHILGIGSLRKYLPHIEHIHSVDSASWDKAAAYGGYLTFRFDKLQDVKVPVLVGYSHPGAKVNSKPPPADVKKRTWDDVVAANGWEKEAVGTKSHLVSLYWTKRYIKALKKFSPVELKEKLASKDGVAVTKMLDDNECSGWEIPDFDPRDPLTPDSGWTVAAVSLEKQREGRLAIGEFFAQPKPTRPAMPEQPQTIDSMVKLYEENPEWLPTFVQKKYDGARHQIHRDGDKVKILSEQGKDYTKRFPGLVKEVLALPSKKLVLDSEIEMWDGRQHLPRETMAGYLASKDAPDDSAVVANVFDVLWTEKDGDIHAWPTWKRLKALGSLGAKQSTMGVPNLKYRINAVPGLKVHDLAQLEKAVRLIRELPGSEGTVNKQADAPYRLKEVTSDEWVKFHNATLVKGVVIDRWKTGGNAWVYEWGLLPGKAEPKKTVEVGSTKVVPVGESLGTKLDFDKGDGIIIEAETINYTEGPDGIEVTAWVPRVIGELPGKPDTVDATVRRAKRDLVLQQKTIDEDGEVTYVPTRKVEKQADPFMELPPPGKKYRFVVQHHWRGKGVHSDFRGVLQPGRLLLGWTLNTQIPGVVKEPVTTLQQAREWMKRIDDISKINWETGEWAMRAKRGASKPVRTSILAERKAPEPYPWLDVEGATKAPKGEEGRPPVGGTRRYPGVFHIVERGTFEYGAQKPWFHEYFVYGDDMKGRLIFRQLQLKTEKGRHSYERCMECEKAKPEVDVLWADGRARAWFCGDCFKAWKSKLGRWAEVVGTKAIKGGVAPSKFSDVHKAIEVSKAVLPPSTEEAGPMGGPSWLAIMPDDLQPYVLDNDAVKKGWMPPVGHCALPSDVRSQVPAEYHYWKERTMAAAKAKRDALVEALRKKEVKLDYAKPYGSSVEKATMLDARFALQEQTWKGPVQVRTGPSRRRWWLRFDVGRRDLVTLELQQNPLDNKEVAGKLGSDPHRDSLEFEGKLKPGHYLNPTKDTPSSIEVLDSGKARVMALSKDLLKVELSGKSLKGLFVAERNDGEWLWHPSKAAPTTKRDEVEFVVPISKVDKEKRLVTGVVLEPDEVDAQKDTISADVIEKAAHAFVAKYNEATRMGFMHKMFGDIGVELVESWLAPTNLNLGGEKVKKGSWIITVKVVSDSLWRKVKSGKITGFSIGGLATVS